MAGPPSGPCINQPRAKSDFLCPQRMTCSKWLFLLRVRLVASLALTLLCSVCSAAPRLFDVPLDAVTPVLLAEAVNHYVEAGEADAVKELRELAWTNASDFGYFFDGYERGIKIGWLCRILFEPADTVALRPPRFGALAGIPEMTMSDRDWPLHPIAHAGISYFVLDHSYLVGGLPETGRAYIQYSQQHGIFRKQRVAVPSRTQAIKDALALRSSKEWRTLKWKANRQGWSYSLNEVTAWQFVRDQAISVDE